MSSNIKPASPKLTLVFVFLSLSLSTVQAQKTTSVKSTLWLNLPSAPLKFVEQEDHLVLDPRSSPSPIKRYGLGCVRQSGGTIKVIKRFGVFIVNSPADMTRFWRVPSGQHGLPKCVLGDKYSIFEVAFIDGAVWRIES